MSDELVYLNVMWGRIDAAGRWHPNPYLMMTADEQRRDNIARGLLPPDSQAPDTSTRIAPVVG